MDFKCFLKIAIVLLGTTASSTVVQTTHGLIKGNTITLFSGKKVDAYLGVPFAPPPTGENRFAPPQPLKTWSQTLDATCHPKSCIQAIPKQIRSGVWFVSDSAESEDCLYLNLWVPKSKTNSKKPVMIWIHGGGFVAGSSNMPLYDGSVLASETDVIVASMNYRLSMFGFLYLNNTEVPGNAGLRDQIQAIEWIKNNAQNFGGDPESITLFGESAGSIAVSFHLLNKNMQSLFQYGILESGTFESDKGLNTEAEIFKSSVSTAAKLGCPVDDSKKTLSCLRQKSVSEIMTLDIGFLPYFKVPFEPVRNGVEVPLDIDTAIKRVPPEKRKITMVGNIPREMNCFITGFFPGKMLNDNFTVSEDDMRVLLTNLNGISDPRLQDLFLHEYRNSSGTYNRGQLRIEATELITDLILLCPGLKFTQEWATGPTQVYYFYFAHRPSHEFKVPVPEWMGVVHGDEIPFVFGRPLEPKNNYTAEEVDLSKKMMTYWSNFAKTGNPNGDKLGELTWPSVTQDGGFSYLVLDLNSTVLTGPLREKECDFWYNVYPSIQDIQDQLNASPST